LEGDVLLRELFRSYWIGDDLQEIVGRYLMTLGWISEATRLHSIRVAAICGKLGKEIRIKGIHPRTLVIAGLLHDIGKINSDQGLLNKDGAFTAEERGRMEAHVYDGWRILRLHRRELQFVSHVAVRHHRFGKKPYPEKLPRLPASLVRHEELINIYARLLALADDYDSRMHRNDGRNGDNLSQFTKREQYLRDNDDQREFILILECAGVINFFPETTLV